MKSKNTLGDLHNHLFAEIERLSDKDLKGEEMEAEIRRADAISGVAQQVIKNGELVIKAMKFRDDKWDADVELPRMLNGDN